MMQTVKSPKVKVVKQRKSDVEPVKSRRQQLLDRKRILMLEVKEIDEELKKSDG